MNPSHMSGVGGGKPPTQQQQQPPPGMLAQQLQMMRPQQQQPQQLQRQQNSPMSMAPSQSPGPAVVGMGVSQMMGHLGPPRGPLPPSQGGMPGGMGGGPPLPPSLMQRAPPPLHPQQQANLLAGMNQGGILPPLATPSMQQQQQQQLTAQQAQHLLQQQQAQRAAVNTLAQQPVSILCRLGAEFTQEIVSKTFDAIQTMRTLTTPQSVNNFSPAVQEEKKAEIKKHMNSVRLCFERLRQMYERVGLVDQVQELGEMKSTAAVLEALIPFKDDSDSDYSEDEDVAGDFAEVEEEEKEDNRMLTEAAASELGELLLPPSAKRVKVEDSFGATSCSSPSASKIIIAAPFEAHRYRGPRIDDERRRRNPKIALLEAEHRELLALSQLKSRQIKEVIDRLRKLVWDINTCLAVSSST